MSENRFAWKVEKLQHSDDEVLLVVDNENKDWKGHILNIVDLLNELNKDFEDCEKLLDSKDDFIHKFMRDFEEQQAIINKQQDLIFSLKKDNQRLRNGLR